MVIDRLRRRSGSLALLPALITALIVAGWAPPAEASTATAVLPSARAAAASTAEASARPAARQSQARSKSRVLGSRTVPLAESSSSLRKPHGAALTVACTSTSRARVGGTSTVVCSVPRADRGSARRDLDASTGPGAAVRAATLRLSIPRSVTVRRVGDGSWRCRRGSEVRCTLPRLRRSASPDAVRLVLQPRRGGVVRSLAARLTWRQQELTGGGDQRITSVGWQRRNAAARLPMDVAPRLAVAATSVSGPTIVTSGGPVTVPVRAVTRGIDGGQVALTWRQLSGPRVAFPDGRQISAAAETTDTRITVPNVKKSQGVCLLATATADGAQVRDRVCARVTPSRTVTLDPRVSSIRKALKEQQPTDAGSVPWADWQGAEARSTRVRINSAGATNAVPSRPVTLRVRGQKLRSVRWRVSEGPRRLLRSAKASDQRLRFRAPAATPTGTFVISATGRARGRAVQVDEVVVLTGGGPAARGGVLSQDVGSGLPFSGYGVAQLGPQDAPVRAQAEGGSAFCALRDTIKDGESGELLLADGTAVELGADATVTGDCGEGRVTFENASLHKGALTFTGLSGSVSADRLRIDGATSKAVWRLPRGWRTAAEEYARELPASLQDRFDRAWERASVPLDLPGNAALVADVDDEGEFSGLRGEFTVDSLAMLPLPGGWSWEDSATLGFEPRTGLMTFEQQGSGGDASLLLAGRMSASGRAALAVTAAGVELVDNDNGRLTGSGTGEIAIAVSREVVPSDQGTTVRTITALEPSLEVEFVGEREGAPHGFAIFTGVGLRKAAMSWGEDGLGLSAALSVQVGDDKWMGLAGAGSYTDADNWSVAVGTESDWPITDTLTIDSVGGTIAKTKGDEDENAAYEFSVGVRAQGELSDRLTLLAGETDNAQLTNVCPAEAADERRFFGKEGACRPGSLRLLVDAAAEIRVGDRKGDRISVTGWVELRTGKFRVAGRWTAGDGGIGPDYLKLRDLAVTATNSGGAELCVPTDPAEGDDEGTAISFTARGTVMDKRVDFVGQYLAGEEPRYCLAGTMKDGVDLGGGTQGHLDLVAFSSYDATVTLPEDDETDEQVTTEDAEGVEVRAGAIVVRGSARLADDVTDELGALSGEGELAAEIETTEGKRGLRGTASYTLANPVRLVGSGSTEMLLRSASLAVDTTEGTSFSISAKADLKVSGDTTPMAATIRVRTGDKTQVSFSSGIDTTSKELPMDGGRPYVADAFGQEGLDLRSLSFGFTAGAGWEVDLQASAKGLPDSWTDEIAIPDRTPVSVGVKFSATRAPCFAFEIGSAGSERTALDIGNKGILTAKHAKFVWAPQACEYTDPNGDTQSLGSGYELAFDGAIGSVSVYLEAKVTLPTESSSRLAIEAKGDIGDFAVGPLTVQRTTADIAFDSQSDKARFRFTGGVRVMDGLLTADDVTVAFDRDGENISMQVSARNAALRVPAVGDAGCYEWERDGTRMPGLNLSGEMAGARIVSFRTDLNCSLTVVGQSVWARGSIDFGEGRLRLLDLTAGIRLNFRIFEVEGNVRICRNGSTFVGVSGTARARWARWSKSYSWDVYGNRMSCNAPAPRDPGETVMPYVPAPPKSTVGTPPVRWLSTPSGCLKFTPTGFTAGDTTPIRCADHTEYSRQAGTATNYWVAECQVHRQDRPCPLEFTFRPRTAGATAAPTVDYELKRVGSHAMTYFTNTTYAGDKPYGSWSQRTFHRAVPLSKVRMNGSDSDLGFKECFDIHYELEWEQVVRRPCSSVRVSGFNVWDGQLRFHGSCLYANDDALVAHSCGSVKGEPVRISGHRLMVGNRCVTSSGGFGFSLKRCAGGLNTSADQTYRYEPEESFGGAVSRPVNTDHYEMQGDRWPACWGSCETQLVNTNWAPIGGNSGSFGNAEFDMMLAYAMRMSPEGRAELRRPGDWWQRDRTLSLDGDRTLPTGAGDGAILRNSAAFQSGDGRGWAQLDRHGHLSGTTDDRGNWRFSAPVQDDGADVVMAVLDDDCRIKLVDDTGITQYESRNHRRFGGWSGDCAWRTLPGAFTSWEVKGGDNRIVECGLDPGGDALLQGVDGPFTRGWGSSRCRVDSDANHEADPVRNPGWWRDNPKR